MSEDVELSPWIEHDGKGFPHEVFKRFPYSEGWCYLYRALSHESGSRTKTPLEQAESGLDPASPSWSWRWKGGLLRKRRRVCIDPDYHPTIKYRFERRKPPAAESSAQVEILRAIAAGVAQPAPEPVREVSG